MKPHLTIYSNCQISICTRQNGKSTLSGWGALWRLYTARHGPIQIVSVANDYEQASIIHRDAKRIITNSGILYGLIQSITRYEIRLVDGSRWIVKSADSVSSRGLRPDVICYDELGFAIDRDLFDTLSAGQAARPNPLMLVTSTVTGPRYGALWELFQAVEAGADHIRLIYRTDNPSPLITEEYLAEQRETLPPSIFAREHGNQWSEGSDAFCSHEDYQRALRDADPRREYDDGPCYAWVDLGWTHDPTAIAVVKQVGEDAVIVALEEFQGSQSSPVDFQAVEARLQQMTDNLNIQRIEIESWQGVQMAQRLDLSIPTNIIHPTAKTNQEHWGALYTSLKRGTVHLPDHARLRQQLLSLMIKTTANGWKVEDVPSIHQDHARAIAGTVKMAEYQPPAVGEIINDLDMSIYKSKRRSIWDAPPKRVIYP